MAIFSKIISLIVSVVMAILNLFGIGGEKRPEFVLGENVNSNVAQVLEVYNNAVIETDKDAPSVKNTMSLEDIKMGSGTSAISFAKPMLKDMLEDEVYEYYDIPGKGELKADDVISAKMSTDEEGLTTVIIEVKSQTDDAYADGENGGPVSRAMGTAGNFAAIFEETGIITGFENVEITYTDCKIACIIDDATDEILYGEWFYNMTMNMDGVIINIGESPIEMTNTSATIGFRYEL